MGGGPPLLAGRVTQPLEKRPHRTICTHAGTKQYKREWQPLTLMSKRANCGNTRSCALFPNLCIALVAPLLAPFQPTARFDCPWEPPAWVLGSSLCPPRPTFCPSPVDQQGGTPKSDVCARSRRRYPRTHGDSRSTRALQSRRNRRGDAGLLGRSLSGNSRPRG